MPRTDLRAARANRDFRTDEKRIRTEITVMDKNDNGFGVTFIQDRRLRADVLFIRVQSAIRADGFSSAQYCASRTSGEARVKLIQMKPQENRDSLAIMSMLNS